MSARTDPLVTSELRTSAAGRSDGGLDTGVGLPPFSSLPLLLLVCIKPLSDALYNYPIVKYGYMTSLVFAALFAKAGRSLHGIVPSDANRRWSPVLFLWLIAVYYFFLVGITPASSGYLNEIFKIVSPFVFFLLVASILDRWLTYALVFASVLTIVANACLLPTSFGWVDWGHVHTFKGFYYFKTDLAYALTFSVLICALSARYVMSHHVVALVLLAGVQIVLANSRLNYLTFALVLAFSVIKGGYSLRNLIQYSMLLGMLAVAAALLYDPSKFLGFDTHNEAAFTQGRNLIWARLLDGFAANDLWQWIFGHGVFGDVTLASETISEVTATDAHNEYLHLVYTQGLLGTALYLGLWYYIIRLVRTDRLPRYARGTGGVAVLLFLLQGITSVMSSYAAKTWPLVMVVLVLRELSTRTDPLDQKRDSGATTTIR